VQGARPTLEPFQISSNVGVGPCAWDKTYLVKRIETSNTILLMQGPEGISNRIQAGAYTRSR